MVSIISCLKATFTTVHTPKLLSSEPTTTAASNEKQILIFPGITLEAKGLKALGGVGHSPVNDPLVSSGKIFVGQNHNSQMNLFSLYQFIAFTGIKNTNAPIYVK